MPRPTVKGAGLRVASVLPRPTLRVVTNDAERRERLAYAIDAAMRKRSMSAPQLAKRIGKSADTIRRWREGQTLPDIFDVADLSVALELSPAYFVTPPPVPEYPIEDYAIELEQVGPEDEVRAQAMLDEAETPSPPRRLPRRADTPK